MKATAAAFILLLVAYPALPSERVTDEQRIIRAAMAAGGCEGTEEISLRLDFSLEELRYTDRCWAAAQKKIVSLAMTNGNCEAVQDLPGIYPMGREV
jgi:hypothetical protein